MRPSTRTGLLIALLAVVFAVAIVLAVRKPTPPPAPPRGEAAAPLAHAPANSPNSPSTPALRPSVAADADTAPTEVCGVGRFSLRDLLQLPAAVLKTLDRSSVLQDAVAQLGASAEPSSRAIALRYQAVQLMRDTAGAAQATGGCAEDSRCIGRAVESGMLTALAVEQALVQLADQSNDPVAFSLAYDACRRPPNFRPTGCDAITVQRWVTIEPDNGIVWLYAAAEAEAHKDDATRRAAIERAAAAARFDTYQDELLRPMANATLRQASPVERMGAHVAALDAVGGVRVEAALQARNFCRAPVAEDRRALCDRLGTQFIDKDSTIIGHAMGLAIGQAVGWPAERIAALREENDAMQATWMGAAGGIEHPLSCAAISASDRRDLDTLRLGERDALRREIKRSGRTVAELAHEYRLMREPGAGKQQAPSP